MAALASTVFLKKHAAAPTSKQWESFGCIQGSCAAFSTASASALSINCDTELCSHRQTLNREEIDAALS